MEEQRNQHRVRARRRMPYHPTNRKGHRLMPSQSRRDTAYCLTRTKENDLITMNFASLNVGTMKNKSHELEDMMIRRRITIMCVQEVKWKNAGDKTRFLNKSTRMHKFYFHGVENNRNGVGIIIPSNLQSSIINVTKTSDRLMSIKLVIGNKIWNVISAYAPQVGCAATEKEQFWLSMENHMKNIPPEEHIFIGADLNGHVGCDNRGDKRWHGGFGHGDRNEAGEEILQFAKAFDLPIMNTFFKKPQKHLATYQSGNHSTQIDYHLCSRPLKNRIMNCKVILGESLAPQHRLLVSKFRLNPTEKLKDTSVPLQKIKWFKIMDDDQNGVFLENAKQWIEDCINVEEEHTADEFWNAFQDGIVNLAKQHLGESKGKLTTKKESWLWKFDTVKKAVAAKKSAFINWKTSESTDPNEIENLHMTYKNLKKVSAKEVAIATAATYQDWYEKLETPDGQKQVFKIAARRRNDSKAVVAPKFINDKNGHLLTQNDEICDRFKEYFDELLNESFPRTAVHNDIPSIDIDIGPFTEEGIRKAVKEMKNGRAVGPDNIPTELYEKCGDIAIDFLCILFNKIRNEGKMPEAFRQSYTLPFYKNKGDSRECCNYRGIRLLVHTFKIYERVVMDKMNEIVLPKIHPNQCGFMPKKTTTDAMQALRIIMEKFRDAHKDLHIVFLDLEKAFDRLPRDLIWLALRWHEVPEMIIDIFKDMYNNTSTMIRCTAGLSTSFPCTIGVHQGACSSPILFNTTMNFLVIDLMEKLRETLPFADDYAMIDDDVIRLQEVLNEWRERLENNGMRISRTKSEYLFCPFNDPQAPSPDLMLDTVVLPHCKSFKYLGGIVNQNCDCDEDVNHRTSVAWLKWRDHSSMFCDPKLPPKLKGRLYTSVVRPAMTYGATTWSLLRKHENKLTATEMKMLRMSSGVTKLDHIKSEHIRGSLQVKNAVVEKVREERINWFEKVHQHPEEQVTKRAMKMNIPAMKRRGAPKTTWLRQMDKRHREYGLTQEEQYQRQEPRRRLRSFQHANLGDI